MAQSLSGVSVESPFTLQQPSLERVINMGNHPLDSSAVSPVCVFRVLSGPQQGACVPLCAGQTFVVSHALSGDIVVRGVPDAALRLELSLAPDGLVLQLDEGQVALKDRWFVPGEKHVLALGTVLTVNGVEIQLGEAAVGPSPDHRAPSAEGAHVDPAVNSSASGESSPSAPPHTPLAAGESAQAVVPVAPAPVSGRRWSVLKPMALGGASLLIASVSMWAVAKVVSPAESPHRQAAKAQALLHSRGWIGARVEAMVGGRLAVSGVFPSEDDRARADRVLSAEGLRADMLAGLQASPMDTVHEVLRVRGVSADVSEISPGHVRVLSALDTQKAERLEADLKADVAGLRHLELINTPPKPESRVPVVDDPGKRVVGVMPGRPAYVVTADGAKYFVGALLPTGHRIREIAGRNVKLDREGQVSALQF